MIEVESVVTTELMGYKRDQLRNMLLELSMRSLVENPLIKGAGLEPGKRQAEITSYFLSTIWNGGKKKFLGLDSIGKYYSTAHELVRMGALFTPLMLEQNDKRNILDPLMRNSYVVGTEGVITIYDLALNGILQNIEDARLLKGICVHLASCTSNPGSLVTSRIIRSAHSNLMKMLNESGSYEEYLVKIRRRLDTIDQNILKFLNLKNKVVIQSNTGTSLCELNNIRINGRRAVLLKEAESLRKPADAYTVEFVDETGSGSLKRSMGLGVRVIPITMRGIDGRPLGIKFHTEFQKQLIDILTARQDIISTLAVGGSKTNERNVDLKELAAHVQSIPQEKQRLVILRRDDAQVRGFVDPLSDNNNAAEITSQLEASQDISLSKKVGAMSFVGQGLHSEASAEEIIEGLRFLKSQYYGIIPPELEFSLNLTDFPQQYWDILISEELVPISANEPGLLRLEFANAVVEYVQKIHPEDLLKIEMSLTSKIRNWVESQSELLEIAPSENQADSSVLTFKIKGFEGDRLDFLIFLLKQSLDNLIFERYEKTDKGIIRSSRVPSILDRKNTKIRAFLTNLGDHLEIRDNKYLVSLIQETVSSKSPIEEYYNLSELFALLKGRPACYKCMRKDMSDKIESFLKKQKKGLDEYIVYHQADLDVILNLGQRVNKDLVRIAVSYVDLVAIHYISFVDKLTIEGACDKYFKAGIERGLNKLYHLVKHKGIRREAYHTNSHLNELMQFKPKLQSKLDVWQMIRELPFWEDPEARAKLKPYFEKMYGEYRESV